MTDAFSADKSIALRYAQITNVGGRQSNQDALGSVRQEDLACFVVSDGAGGHEGGEIAANLVVKAILDSFLRELSFSNRAIRSYVEHAIVQVARSQAEGQRLKNMSATVAAILIDQKNRVALWAHMGDTRIYLFRGNKVHTMTRDHSLVQQFIDAGYCKPEQARTHLQRSVLFAAIGAEGDTVPEITEDVVRIQDGDAFLICSDGFWEWVTEDDMEQTLARSAHVDDWLAGMSSIAEKNGRASLTPRDNYTALTIWLDEPENTSISQ